jgi:hypothetical protein
MAKPGDGPQNGGPGMAFDGYIVRADGYGPARKGTPPVKQRPAPPAPIISQPVNTTGGHEETAGR